MMGRDHCIKVLQITNDMGRGGVETWLMHVFRNMERTRFVMDFMVFTDRKGEYDDEIRALGGKLFPSSHPKHFIRFSRDLREILNTHGPYRAVHSHSPLTDGFSLRVARLEGVPVRIVHSHNDMRQVLPNNFFKRLVLHWSIQESRRSATHGLAASRLAAVSYFGDGWQKDPRWRIHLCGLDFSPFNHNIERNVIRKALGIPEKAFVIGHVGVFRSQKNHTFLLEIAAKLTKSNPEVRFLLVGNGPLEEQIRKRVTELGLDEQVKFAGSRPDVPALMLGAMDLFLFPSKFEGLGLALVEAQAAGLPCVYSDVIPAEADVVPMLCRRLSLSQSPSEWTQVILEMRKSKQTVSKEESLRIVEKSQFNLSNSIKELEEIYSIA